MYFGFHSNKPQFRSGGRLFEQAGQSVVIATIAREEGSTGVHTHTRILQQGLGQLGYHVDLVNPFTSGVIWQPLFAVRRIFLDAISVDWSTRWYRYWHRMALLDNLQKRLSQWPCDVVIAQCPLAASAALELRRTMGLDFRIIMVCHFNYSEATEFRELGQLHDEDVCRQIEQFEKDVMQGVDEVVYVSDWARRIVEEKRGIHPRLSQVIPNGIPPLTSHQRLSRSDIGLSETDLALINVGTLEPRKNQLGLLDLFSEVAKRCPAAKLVLVGEGASRDLIERRIEVLGLDGKVKLLGARRDVLALLPLANCYVHYAQLENCPISLIEAARAGLPIAAVASGGIPELLAAFGGLALDAADTQASADSLIKLLESPRLRNRAADQALQGFGRSYTSAAMLFSYASAIGSFGGRLV